MSVGVGKRRQKEVLANRSGARDREENKNALHAEPVELPAKMLEDAVGSELTGKPTQLPVHL